MGDIMRVISGIYKGKKLDGFDIDGTRPTMDRVKESMFGMIQNKVKDTVCLDLFAGSGALGIEAISMGSKMTYFVDNGYVALKVLKSNLSNIKESNKILEFIVTNNLLNKKGVVVAEYEEEHIVTSLKLIKSKKYGPKTVDIYGCFDNN